MSDDRATISGEIRVWAEEVSEGEILLTWQWPEAADAPRDSAADARAIAATVGVLPGVSSAEPTPDGVRVHFDRETTDKATIAAGLRSALLQEGDLKARAGELMKRAPTYASLAKSLALDERVSPMPEVARQARSRTATPLRAAPLRMIPGFPIVAQLYTLLPMLRALSSWSREASPEIVEEHLSEVGLTREQLDRDLATAQESLLFAKDYAAGTAARAAAKATAAATHARDAAREWVDKRNQPPAPRRYEP